MPKSCAKCGKVGPALCDRCANSRKVSPQYHSKEYLKNRSVMIKVTWENGIPCWLCGYPFMTRKDITADHKVPLRDGGTHALANLAPAHERCNKGRFRKKKKEKPAPIIDATRKNNDFLDWSLNDIFHNMPGTRDLCMPERPAV